MAEAPDIDWDEVSRGLYERALRLDWGWTEKANQLLAAAELIAAGVTESWKGKKDRMAGRTDRWPADYSATYLMLIGFAVENLLKGVVVRLRSQELRAAFESPEEQPTNERRQAQKHTKRHLPSLLGTHDLMKLLRVICTSKLPWPYEGFVDFPLTIQEEDLLRRLTLNAEWYGRYPIPISYHHAGEGKFSDGKTYNLRWFGEGDVEKVRALVGRIRQEFNIR